MLPVLTVLVNNECMPRSDFFNLIVLNIEGSFYSRLLRGNNNNFVICIKVCRPDAI